MNEPTSEQKLIEALENIIKAFQEERDNFTAICKALAIAENAINASGK